MLYNAALKFDATFNVLVFPLDVGKRFARLITHALREVRHRGLDQASMGHYDAVAIADGVWFTAASYSFGTNAPGGTCFGATYA